MGDEEPQHPAPQVVYLPTNVPFPGRLDMKGNLATNWRKFKRVWTNYEIASNLSERDMGHRTATLLTCMGADALEIFDGLKFENEAQKTKRMNVTNSITESKSHHKLSISICQYYGQ
jgi:hypothetical protein